MNSDGIYSVKKEKIYEKNIRNSLAKQEKEMDLKKIYFKKKKLVILDNFKLVESLSTFLHSTILSAPHLTQ